jgi:hypothetical protein
MLACAGGALTMAYSGNPLATMAQVKEQIMLTGGVIMSMALSAGAFGAFVTNMTSQSGVFGVAEDLTEAAPGNVAMHAVFCYGWWDNAADANDGYWICKNRCAAGHVLPLSCPSHMLRMAFGCSAIRSALSSPLQYCHVNSMPTILLAAFPGCSCYSNTHPCLTRHIVLVSLLQLGFELGPQRLIPSCLWRR